jgi:hypothetical protein
MNRLSARGLRIFTALVASTATLAMAPGLTSSSSATTQWTLVPTSATPVAWSSVDYLDGQWVALSDGGEVGLSDDGSTWTEQSAPLGSWVAAAYGAGHYVALSSANTVPNEMISENAQEWTTVAGPPGSPRQAGRPTENGQWTSLAYGDGLFVAVSSVGTVDTSPNGVTWSRRFWRPKNSFTSITFGDGRFIAVDAAQGDVLMSLNGVNWSLLTRPLIGAVAAPSGGLHFGAVTYGDGNFVAFGDSPSGAGYVATSVFGYVWTLHQYSPAEAISTVAFGCGSFVAGGQSMGTSNPIITSSTGETWTSNDVATPALPTWTALAYGAGKYLALDAAGDIALSSGTDCTEAVPSAPLQVSGNVHNGEVWTYMHPSSSAGGAPVEGYRVAVSDGVTTTYCRAAVYYQPNCIIKGLQNHRAYWVTAQAYNRFGYSAPTDPEFVTPVAAWSLAVTAPSRTVEAASQPSDASGATSLDLQLTGIIANAQGFYPVTTVSIHFGSRVETCHPNPFGECLVTVIDPQTGAIPTFATYTGYGRTYRSPTSVVVVRSS